MSKKQQQAWDTLINLTADGWPCTVREFGEAMGYMSPATAQWMLEKLEGLGYAERRGRKGWKPRYGMVAP